MINLSSAVATTAPSTPYAQVGQIPVGQESALQRLQRIRPVEQTATVANTGAKKRGAQDASVGSAEGLRPKVEDKNQDKNLDKSQAAKQALRQKSEQSELEQLKQLASRDREVRAHEQAHKAAAGSYGGAIHFEYQRGPDGNRYAVGGEVSIDTSPESSPEATLAKARTIQRAANAPAAPSDQDRAVAAQAVQMAQMALQQIAEQHRLQAEPAQENAPAGARDKSLDMPEAKVKEAPEAKVKEAPSGVSSTGSERAEAATEYPAARRPNDERGHEADKVKRLEVYKPVVSGSLNFHAQA